MIDDRDIWRAANIMVKRHGADARIAAAQRADQLLDAGDVTGFAVWKRIVAAIEDIQSTVPQGGEPLN